MASGERKGGGSDDCKNDDEANQKKQRHNAGDRNSNPASSPLNVAEYIQSHLPSKTAIFQPPNVLK